MSLPIRLPVILSKGRRLFIEALTGRKVVTLPTPAKKRVATPQRRSTDLCIYAGCGLTAVARGICRNHFAKLRRQVVFKGRTWEEFEFNKLCLPRKRVKREATID